MGCVLVGEGGGALDKTKVLIYNITEIYFKSEASQIDDTVLGIILRTTTRL